MFGTEYICVANFTPHVPDAAALEMKLLEIGLRREAFSITMSPAGNTLIKFWEPDRPEAIRLLAKLDEMSIS
jgi:hypothetical protein